MRLSAETRAALQRHAASNWPEECCGALLVAKDGAVTVRPLANAAPQPTRAFALSARDYLAVETEAEARGLEVLGFYHSHPDGSAVPSGRDAEFASGRWWTVILPVTKAGAGAPRAWRFDEARRGFDEVPLD
jgi:proteasome lid subunit RPN8/RPN11